MSRALVIKGANFSENKVETITFGELIPCTALTLSEDSLAFTQIGQTRTLTASPVPADTTDSVVWQSSDPGCATVTDGLVTCVGVGTAVITAACGTRIASCSVTASVTLDANAVLSAQNGYTTSGNDLSVSKDYIGLYASARARLYLSPDPTPAGRKAISYYDETPWDALYPIMIPANTGTIRITVPSELALHCTVSLLDSTAQPTYNISKKGVRAVSDPIRLEDSGYELDLTGYSGYDSFAFYCQGGGGDASEVTGDVTVVFS